MQTTTRRQTAIETLTNHTEMTAREAEVFVLRELARIRRGDVARELDISENTVDNHLRVAREKFALPNISSVDRVSARETPDGEGRAWDIWFPNGARVRYVWDEIGEEIVEKTYLASDPDSAHNSWGVQGSEDELADYTLETLQEFTQTWRDDAKACAVDMPDLFAAVVCYEPPRQWR